MGKIKSAYVFFLLIGLAGHFLPACKNPSSQGGFKPEVDTIPDQAEIRIRFYSFWGNGPTCFFKYKRNKIDTIYILTPKKINEVDSILVFKQSVSASDADSILIMAKSVFKNFPFFGKNNIQVSDGLSISLSLQMNDSSVDGYWHGLTGTNDLPESALKVIRFINQKLPKNHQLE